MLDDYDRLLTICRDQKCTFRCSLDLRVSEGDDEALEAVLQLLRHSIVHLHLTFSFPSAAEFNIKFPCLQGLLLDTAYFDDRFLPRSWHADWSLARIINEMSAPALHALDMSLYVMDGRYLNMLQAILGVDSKFPELKGCITRHRNHLDSDAMDDALSTLAACVRERGEVDWLMRSLSHEA